MTLAYKRRYAAWITAHVGDVVWEETANGFWHMARTARDRVDGEPLIQRCDVAAPRMASRFPELTPVNGHYRSEARTHGTWMYHCWCVEHDGTIVDPTGRQFDIRGEPDSFRLGEYKSS